MTEVRPRLLNTNDRHAVSVKVYGAVGDGVRDDRQAIFDAHESLRYTGGALFFPAGVYRISAPMCWTAANVGEYDNITWCGEGRSSQIVIDPGAATQPSPGVGVLSFLGERTQANWEDPTKRLQGLTLRDLRITGTTEAAGGTGVDCVLIHIDQSRGARLINLYLDDHPREGIHFGDARRNNDAWIENCHATRLGGYGASIGQYTAAYNPNCDSVVMVGNIAYQCGCGVEFTGRSASFLGNHFIDIGWTDGVFARSSPALMQSNLIGLTDPSERVVVSGNTFDTCGAAISINTARTASITGNSIEKCDNGIAVGDKVLSGVVSENTLYETISGSNGTAITIGTSRSSAGSVLVSGNVITAGSTAWAYGVRVLDDTAPHVIAGNTFVGKCFTTRGIVVDADNTAAQVLDNEFMTGAWGVYGAAVFYEWRGQNLTYNGGITGIRNGVRLSTVQPSVVRAAAPPTIGTWSVGDRCINTAPGSGGVEEWVCVTAGTPGSWAPVGAGMLAPGPCTLIANQWHIQYKRLQLTGSQRRTYTGNARQIITDL